MILFGITELPYAAGQHAAPPGQQFDGLIAYPGEIHAYLSFVRQSAEGRWLFENRYTPEAHTPVYFNFEWLLVGWATRLVGDPAALVAWRAAGVAVLTFGFWFLSAALPRRRDRLLALGVFCLGGGTGWLFRAATACGFLGAVPPDLQALFGVDLVWGVQPFVQMLQNPHFSFPHGLVLLALTVLVVAEKTARTSAYAAAGGLAFAACASRPYEITAFFVLLPALHLFSGDVTNLRRGAQRALTLLVLSPAFLAAAVLLWNPSFRPWSKQGVIPPLPVLGFVVLLGLPALALGVRIARDRALPFHSPVERVLLLWAGAVVLLSQANRFTSVLGYSSQVVITAMGPLVLLSIPLITGGTGSPRPWSRQLWIAIVVLALSLPSSVVVFWQRWQDATTDPSLFVSDGEILGWDWLAREAKPSDLVLTSFASGNRLPRHVGAHVVPGQWALTPDYGRRVAETDAFFAGALSPDEAADYVRRLGVDWLWIGPRERALGGWVSADFAPGCEVRYKHLGVRIYRCGG